MKQLTRRRLLQVSCSMFHEKSMKHECNNLILSCIDFRFHEAINNWVKETNLVGDYDLVSIAGAQKNVVNPETKDFFMNQLAISVRLHKPKAVILLAHQDCGAYGGSKAFANWAEEKAKYIEDLNSAEVAIKAAYPEMYVAKLIVTFDESWKIRFENV